MAKTHFNPLEDPPSASSSEDNEVETSSEKDEEQISNSSSFQENKPKDPIKISSTKTLKISKQDSDSDSPAVKSGKKRASEGTTKDKRAKKSSALQVKSSVNLKKIEESDVNGSDSESTNWFEKSFLDRSIVSLGVDEYFVKQEWSNVPIETKKRMEEQLKLLKAKEIELFLQKIDILKEVTSLICEAIEEQGL